MFKKSSMVYFSLVAALLLGGCGSSSDDASASSATSDILKSAYLSDSRLAGITYTCASETGITDNEGKFSYSTACTEVSFSIGGINLGTLLVSEIHEDSVLYPSDLLGLDRNNTSNPQLVNMLQLLQSLDNDANPNNGISITSTTRSDLEGATLDLDSNTTSITDINSTLSGINVKLIDSDYAIAHYEDTLRNDLNISVDTVAPAPAVIVSSPIETYTDATEVTINGEVGAKVFVNNLDFNITIDSNNSATILLNTADNTDVNNTSAIVLMDDANRSSDAVTTSIFRASQATLDIREVSSIKTALEASTQPRSFTYIQMWNSGEDYNISFSPIPALTVENQDYNATATISKGLATDTLSIPESLAFSQDLRDATEIASLKQTISTATPRSFTYTQEWPTGSDYNVTFSLETKTPTVETQTYDVVAILTKGSTTDSVTFSETVPFSQALRDAVEIAALKSVITSRNYIYAQQWQTGDTYNVNFSEALRTPTTENQIYNVTTTLIKGNITDTVIFTETVPFSQTLRDITEVIALKGSITSRNFTYTQQWITGDAYNVIFSESLRTPTTETQTYNVTTTLTKGNATDSLMFQEIVPFSQDLRDSIEVSAIRAQIETLNDYRSSISYSQQWNTGTSYSLSYSEPRRISTAVDQSYPVTITITKGNETDTFTYTELVPTTNVTITLGDGTTTLINDKYKDAYTVTDGGIFQKVGDESKFVGTSISIDASQLSSSISSSVDLLNYIINHTSISGLTAISSKEALDGSLTSRYEINNNSGTLYADLEILLASLNYSITGLDLSLYTDVTNVYVDFYVEYDSVNNSYVIIVLTDKSTNFDNDIIKIVNKDSIIETTESIVNKTESFTITNTTRKGDFIFVIDDSGSMGQQQATTIDAIERTFSLYTSKYNLDWKATVLGTEARDDYSSFTSAPSENNITMLSAKLNDLTTGGSDERGLKIVYQYIQDGSITERANSSTTIIYASDEHEHSSLNEFGETDEDFTNSYFAMNNIRYNAIIPTSYNSSSEYAAKMSLATGGERVDITNYTSGYDRMMELAIIHAVAESSSVKLTYPALASSITVTVDGVKEESWEYDLSNDRTTILFDAAHAPTVGSKVVVTYSHLDYSAMIADAKVDFEALSDADKRQYSNRAINITFDPAQPLNPLADSDQTDTVTVTFEKLGYTETSTYTETVLASDFYTVSNDGWTQNAGVYVSRNSNSGETSILEVAATTDTMLYVDFYDKSYDRLTISKNGTQIEYFNTSNENQTLDINVTANDVIKFEYYKYYSSSASDYNTTVSIYTAQELSDKFSEAKSDFDALTSAQRDYTNRFVNVTFNPATSNIPLQSSDQIYDVTVTFEKDGSTLVSSFSETIYSMNHTSTVTSSTDWTQTGNSFISQNETARSTTTLEFTMQRDTIISYEIANYYYETLKVYINNTLVETLSPSSYKTLTSSLNVLQGDQVKFEHYKYYDSSASTYNASIYIK